MVTSAKLRQPVLLASKTSVQCQHTKQPVTASHRKQHMVFFLCGLVLVPQVLSIVRASIKAQSTAAHGTCGSVECSFFDSFDVGHQLLAGPVDLPRPIQSHGLFGQFRFDSGTVVRGFTLFHHF